MRRFVVGTNAARNRVIYCTGCGRFVWGYQAGNNPGEGGAMDQHAECVPSAEGFDRVLDALEKIEGQGEKFAQARISNDEAYRAYTSPSRLVRETSHD